MAQRIRKQKRALVAAAKAPVAWARHIMVCLTLGALIGAAYVNCYRSGMVLDNRYIIQEYYRDMSRRPDTQDAQSWAQVKLILTHDYWWPKGIGGLYRPITSLSYWLDYAILTGKPNNLSWPEYANTPFRELETASYHTINLIIHWCNAVMVYLLGLTLLRRFWPAALAAALYAIHPITVESVTNIIGRADLLAAFTTLGSLLLYIRSLKHISADDSLLPLRRVPWLLGIMLLVFVGLFSKESAICVGLIVPMYWLIYHFKLARGWRPVMHEMIAWAFMLPSLMAMLGVRWWIYRNETPPEEPFLDNPIRGDAAVAKLHLQSFAEQLAKKPVEGLSFIERKMTAFKVLGKLVGQLCVPWRLSADYSYSQIPQFSWHLHRFEDWKAIIAIVALATILAFAIFMLRRSKLILFCVLFFFFAALPTSNLIVVIGSIMAERFMYLPLVGFVLLLSAGTFAASRAIGTKSWLAGVFLCIVLTLYGGRTFLRNFDWESDLTLWRATMRDTPYGFRAYQSLAFAMYEQHWQKLAQPGVGPKSDEQAVDEMIGIASGALPLVDSLPDQLNSSRLYMHLGMYATMKAEYFSRPNADGTIDITPESAHWYQNAANALERGSQIDRAFCEVMHARQLLRGDDPNAIADQGLDTIYEMLSGAYLKLHQYDRAIARARYALHLNEANTTAYFTMSQAQASTGDLDAAAITLIKLSLMSTDANASGEVLSRIYLQLMPNSPQAAFIDGDWHKGLNVENPIVAKHVELAVIDLIRMLRASRAPKIADQVYDTAVHQFGLPAKAIDAAMTEPIMKVTPQGIGPS